MPCLLRVSRASTSTTEVNDKVKNVCMFFVVFIISTCGSTFVENAKATITQDERHLVGDDYYHSRISEATETISEIKARNNIALNQLSQRGNASWYGDDAWRHQIWYTATDEVFKPDGVSCAHKTLPLHSIIKVTNRRNGNSVICRVNDRGPYWPGRIVDLSEGAAKKIGLVDKRGRDRNGVIPVVLEVLRLGPSNTNMLATRRDL